MNGIGMTGYPALVIVACALLSYLARRLAPSSKFLHSALGATLLAVVTGAASVVAQAVTAHGLSLASIQPAVVGFLLSFLASSNPSVTAGDTVPGVQMPAGKEMVK
jgi:hypothetical protein